jgi:hypothetical protein
MQVYRLTAGKYVKAAELSLEEDASFTTWRHAPVPAFEESGSALRVAAACRSASRAVIARL